MWTKAYTCKLQKSREQKIKTEVGECSSTI